MIVKILPPSSTFKGVSYNTNKIEKDKGELMKVENFGALQALDYMKPSDYINYLEARSKTSARVKYPQFHAVISCKGKSHSKEQLTEIATDWLKGMGYEKQPYLLIFHKDTDNNHIHIVSTCIGEDGKKINDSYEKIRAYQVLNQVIGVDEKLQVSKDLDQALSYRFSTRAQFMMLLESKGYSLKLTDGTYQLIKFGKEQGSIDAAKVDARIKMYDKNVDRLAQLRAITEKYRIDHDPRVQPLNHTSPGGLAGKSVGYTSQLAELLASKFGVQVIFHGKDGLPPYGYTLIDHSQKRVYKGGDLMPLADFIKPSITPEPEQFQNVSPKEELIVTPNLSFENHVDPTEDNEDIQSLLPQEQSGETFNQNEFALTTGAKSDDKSQEVVDQEMTQSYTPHDHVAETLGHNKEAMQNDLWQSINIDLADDIDDEAILGRNRRRKRKARTNTR